MDWKRFFDSLGMNGTHWQWRIMNWQRRFENWCDGFRHRKQRVTYENKFCNGCGALLGREEKVCPHCQAKAPSWRAQVAKRAFGFVTPSWMSMSTVILLVTVAVSFTAFYAEIGNAIMSFGSLVPPAFRGGDRWRLITYGYLHGNLMHIAFNMLVLCQVGPVLEKELGLSRFFTLYTLSLIGGGVADVIVRPDALIHIIGASGAMFGLIGFGVSYSHFYGGVMGREQRNFFLHWAMYGFIFGLAVGADNIAHAGGFITGLVLGYLIERERANRDRLTPIWNLLAVVCAGLTLLSLTWLGLVVFAVTRGA